MTVLAEEELGKALWVNEAFAQSWSNGDDHPIEVAALAERGRGHVQKYKAAYEYGDELASFWGDYENLRFPMDGEGWEHLFRRREAEAQAAAKAANLAKQSGFYVDLGEAETISSPADIQPQAVTSRLRRAALVVEMLLIRDHIRMKHESTTPYDGTQPQQKRLLAIAHPDLFEPDSSTAT